MSRSVESNDMMKECQIESTNNIQHQISHPKELKCVNDAGKGRNLCETKTGWLSWIDIQFKEVQ